MYATSVIRVYHRLRAPALAVVVVVHDGGTRGDFRSRLFTMASDFLSVTYIRRCRIAMEFVRGTIPDTHRRTDLSRLVPQSGEESKDWKRIVPIAIESLFPRREYNLFRFKITTFED